MHYIALSSGGHWRQGGWGVLLKAKTVCQKWTAIPQYVEDSMWTADHLKHLLGVQVSLPTEPLRPLSLHPKWIRGWSMCNVYNVWYQQTQWNNYYFSSPLGGPLETKHTVHMLLNEFYFHKMYRKTTCLVSCFKYKGCQLLSFGYSIGGVEFFHYKWYRWACHMLSLWYKELKHNGGNWIAVGQMCPNLGRKGCCGFWFLISRSSSSSDSFHSIRWVHV